MLFGFLLCLAPDIRSDRVAVSLSLVFSLHLNSQEWTFLVKVIQGKEKLQSLNNCNAIYCNLNI